MSDKATPRPWKLVMNRECPSYITSETEEAIISCYAGSGYATREDAEFIVEAVNSHDALKARVEKYEKALNLLKVLITFLSYSKSSKNRKAHVWWLGRRIENSKWKSKS